MWQPGRVLGALGLAVLVVSVFAVQTSIGRANAIVAVTVRTPLRINPPTDILTPPPSDIVPALTPEGAYEEYEQQLGDPVMPIPANVTVRLGMLRSPLVGEPSQLAYGYAWSPCKHHTRLRPEVEFSPGGPCTWWDFVDATTGQMIRGVTFHRAPRFSTGAPPFPLNSRLNALCLWRSQAARRHARYLPRFPAVWPAASRQLSHYLVRRRACKPTTDPRPRLGKPRLGCVAEFARTVTKLGDSSGCAAAPA